MTNTVSKLEEYNNFLGLNIGNSPSYVLKEAWANGAWLLVIGAIAIPVLSALTQWINVKLMPQQDTSSNNGNDQAAAMASSMKTMNMIMPLMSAWFCFTLPSGLGLYWVAGSVVRSIQQIVINKHIDKMDFDDIIRKNSAKSAKKLEKMKEQQDKLNAYASMNTKNIQKKANISSRVDNSEVFPICAFIFSSFFALFAEFFLIISSKSILSMCLLITICWILLTTLPATQ